MMDEAGKMGLADAVEAFFKAGKAGKYEEAASAFADASSICGEYGEDDMEEESGPKEKKPIAAILIGGPGPKK